jgi:UDP-N-acetylglucosamine 2-epimerase (non-hydrolysing)
MEGSIDMKKILIVFGTRPEAIKMAPLIRQFRKYPMDFQLFICVTAQHREMLDQVLELFDIVPDYDLNIMISSQDLYDVTSNVLVGMKKVLKECKPDLVIVHGDTNTTMATALAAFYRQIEIAHIEAGLRSCDLYAPFPEEANRQIVGVLANYHFAPTKKCAENLMREHIPEKNIAITGNTVIDALFLILDKIQRNRNLRYRIIESLKKWHIDSETNRRIVLVTGHRRENLGEGILSVCEALRTIALRNRHIDIVYPVHPNPDVRNPVREILSDIKNVYLTEPLSYATFVYLMSKSYMVVTDSGGIQEEAPSLGKPVLVTREKTEREEAIEAGAIKLVGTDKEIVAREIQALLDDEEMYRSMAQARNPYGDGGASRRIVTFLKERL